ncbi:hypothetical protein CEXT_487151 [Caerostris extrusa]|uniref:Uncharacterized protein n=1 Tax=Caerostris extrusa TaxID=172846 RepID=A0AAV4MH93_CAEEX|nr:hypothetical protein CEXT_487151 [Caerostris extrusa]
MLHPDNQTDLEILVGDFWIFCSLKHRWRVISPQFLLESHIFLTGERCWSTVLAPSMVKLKYVCYIMELWGNIMESCDSKGSVNAIANPERACHIVVLWAT